MDLPPPFWECVKQWYENREIRSDIKVKDIQLQPLPTPQPRIRILKILENAKFPSFFFLLVKVFLDESGFWMSMLPPLHFQKRCYVTAKYIIKTRV